jgi:polysaccharide export outer membrane protein
MAARYDVSEIQAGRAQDPLLQANDVLVAGSSAIKQGFGLILKALPIAGLFAFL